jgi:hypothetical protein
MRGEGGTVTFILHPSAFILGTSALHFETIVKSTFHSDLFLELNLSSLSCLQFFYWDSSLFCLSGTPVGAVPGGRSLVAQEVLRLIDERPFWTRP